jgi:hypothetical protein
MLQKGWTRIQGYANESPKQPHFRGPEGDDDFTTASPDDLMQRIAFAVVLGLSVLPPLVAEAQPT